MVPRSIEAIDPDWADSTPQDLPKEDRAALEGAAAQHDVDVDVLTRVGDPARALADVAEQYDAVMIIVGARTGRRRVAEFFDGSVAARLTHQQHRPVLVVPMEPVAFADSLPWHAL
jgi:nucleotide-binding universal stress UspA family protein